MRPRRFRDVGRYRLDVAAAGSATTSLPMGNLLPASRSALAADFAVAALAPGPWTV